MRARKMTSPLTDEFAPFTEYPLTCACVVAHVQQYGNGARDVNDHYRLGADCINGAGLVHAHPDFMCAIAGRKARPAADRDVVSRQ
jgi:hypothetical protein